MPTQTTNTTTHLTFSADSQTWIIAPGVIVSDDTYSIAVEALSANVVDTLVNHGSILSPYPRSPGFTVAGVAMGGTDDVVFNEADGIITGLNGIVCGGSASFVRNDGSVTGWGDLEYGVTFVGNASNSQLFNTGSIYGQGAGVYVQTADSSVVNEAGGIITGYDGIGFTNQIDVLNNYGSINAFARHGVTFQGGANFIHFTNSGHIFGPQSGVIISSGFGANSSLNNSGVIESDQYGLWLINGNGAIPPGRLDVISNTGTISGSVAAIFTGDGDRIALNNAGTLIGDVLCTTANATDTVVNTGRLAGTVHLGGGDDVFIGRGGSSGEVFGGLGNDRLVGGSHADLLDGGDGNDTLTGGPGADQFFFDSALNAVTNVDKITDFKSAQHDKIVLSLFDFPGIGSLGPLHATHFHLNHAGPSIIPQIIYTPGNGFLSYDANGDLPGGMTHFATLTTHPTLHASDFLVEA